MTAADPWLEQPLTGVHAIEASAGTGKTFTLATLFTRLVLERKLAVGQILAVTFTDAATQELRARVRKRLLLAAVVAAALQEGTLPQYDAGSEEALMLAMIQAWQARSGETARTVQRRLRQAADDIDMAAIFTIHGFCHRVLREHALESGQAFDAPELLASDAALRAGIAADLWRALGQDEVNARDLHALWPKGPDDLAGDLSALVRAPVLLPAPPAQAPPDTTPQLRAACKELAVAARGHAEGFRDELLAARMDGVLNGQSYNESWIRPLFAGLATWCVDEEPETTFWHDKLVNLTAGFMAGKTNKKAPRPAPDSPLCEAVASYLQSLDEIDDIDEKRRLALLHHVRADARRRLAQHKRQARVLTYDDLIDRVADALDGRHGNALANALRKQYPVALVDEFQDTDPRQWRIFQRVFAADADGGKGTLFLIGDPKQSIYRFRGGDVDTYLAAREVAQPTPPLDRNFRSRPALLAGIQALYEQAQAAHDANPESAPAPFQDTRIQFHAVQPGGTRSDGDYQRRRRTAPALTVWRAPPSGETDAKGNAKAWSSPDSHAVATDACVAAIHGVLADARAGKARINTEPVQPGDIAVLVRTHRQAVLIRDALGQVGIPAVAAGRQSLFATDEAWELHALLQAVVHAADDRRLRAALATVLVGGDAAAIAALDEDGPALQAWQLEAMVWRERLHRGGPLALIGDLCAASAPRLLALMDGERRLTNYLQLAEHLQEAQRRTLGLHGLLDWLALAIAGADDGDETQQLRLESDARRVQIVTLHKSKGLEYPLVFLPYVGIGGQPRSPGRHVTISKNNGERVLHWRLQAESSGWKQACDAWKAAEQAEDARLLYVGLTRARDALWLATGPLYGHTSSPLRPLVANVDALAEELTDDLGKAAAGTVLHIDKKSPAARLDWLPPEAAGTVPEARVPGPPLRSDWWVYSFTQLARSPAGDGADPASAATQAAPGGLDEPDEAPTAGTETAPGPAPVDERFLGPGFGVVLHEVFENTDFSAWTHWRAGELAPAGQDQVIAAALRAGGYAADLVEPGLDVIVPLIGHTLTARLPEGVALANVPEQHRRAEIEFQFSLSPTRVDALLALLHSHGVLTGRRSLGARHTLEGLMTGLIDLTYLHDGRWYVLDWKSNRLPGYGPARLAEAMAHSAYELQALIYTLALHRWLRFRLGDGYDYERDFGGARYLFCRGIDAGRDDGQGIQAWRFEPELVHALDALFAGDISGAAA